MANVLEQPMSSQQRQNLADSLMGSIGAVLQSSDETQSSNDTDQVKKKILQLLNRLTGSTFFSATPFQPLIFS